MRPDRCAGPSRANQSGYAEKDRPIRPQPPRGHAARTEPSRRVARRSRDRRSRRRSNSEPTAAQITTMTSTSVLKKNWSVTSSPSDIPDPHRSPRLADEQLVETADDERHETRNVVIRWPPATFTNTKGEKPKTSPPTKAAGVQRTQRRSSQNIAIADSAGSERGRHVHGGHGTEQPCDRGQHDTDGKHACVREQVYASRVEQRRGIERVVAVGDRVRRPLQEPDEQRGVAAGAARDARRVSRPDVPPQADRKRQVAAERDGDTPASDRPSRIGTRRSAPHLVPGPASLPGSAPVGASLRHGPASCLPSGHPRASHRYRFVRPQAEKSEPDFSQLPAIPRDRAARAPL